MAGDDKQSAVKAEEFTEVIRSIRERVRARYPQTTARGDIALPDLMPLVHARDAAEAKVAAIGTVNPRQPGLMNTLLQAGKRVIARLLDWHVREQVEFNRALIHSVEALLETLNDYNRALVRLADADASLRAQSEAAIQEALQEVRELKDIRSHWSEWRQEWERKLSINEVQFLRGVADLQSAFQHRVTLMESNFRDMVRAQHSDFEGALERSGAEIQKTLWADLKRIRTDYERLIHAELRVVRQRAATLPPAMSVMPAPSAPAGLPFDYLRFASRFRGTEDYVREKQRTYLPVFQGLHDVLDIGCGRGEFLDLLREAGISARGIDLSPEEIAICRSKGLAAETADMFVHLAELPEGTLGGIFCSQVIEHVPPGRIPEFVRLAASRLTRNGILVIETPNPECLAIFATHFYLDPTHTRPVPSALLAFYMEEFGLGRIEVRRLSPAVEIMPSLAELPAEFREAFFGGLDYAILGRKL